MKNQWDFRKLADVRNAQSIGSSELQLMQTGYPWTRTRTDVISFRVQRAHVLRQRHGACRLRASQIFALCETGRENRHGVNWKSDTDLESARAKFNCLVNELSFVPNIFVFFQTEK